MSEQTLTLVSRETSSLTVDVRPDVGAKTALLGRFALAALPLTRDRVESRQDVVLANQPSTADGSVTLATTGDGVVIDLNRLAPRIERVSVVAFLHPRANAGKPTLADLVGLGVTVRDEASGVELLRQSDVAHNFAFAPAGVILDVVRCNDDASPTPTGERWGVEWTQRGYEAGLAGLLAQKGLRL